MTARKTRRTHPGEHLANKHPRGVRASWCKTCGEPILTGLDADVLAVRVKVDLRPLDAMGELLAALETPSRPTYTLTRAGGPARLERRLRREIRSRAPGGKWFGTPYDVVPAHRCGVQLPEVPTALPPPVKPTRAQLNAKAPF